MGRTNLQIQRDKTHQIMSSVSALPPSPAAAAVGLRKVEIDKPVNWGLGVAGTCPQLELTFMLVLRDSYKEEYRNHNKLPLNTLQVGKN